MRASVEFAVAPGVQRRVSVIGVTVFVPSGEHVDGKKERSTHEHDCREVVHGS